MAMATLVLRTHQLPPRPHLLLRLSTGRCHPTLACITVPPPLPLHQLHRRRQQRSRHRASQSTGRELRRRRHRQLLQGQAAALVVQLPTPACNGRHPLLQGNGDRPCLAGKRRAQALALEQALMLAAQVAVLLGLAVRCILSLPARPRCRPRTGPQPTASSPPCPSKHAQRHGSGTRRSSAPPWLPQPSPGSWRSAPLPPPSTQRRSA